MYVYKQSKALSESLERLKKEGKTIGFFPTMGALHKGHLSLLKEARKLNDIVVSSIFVNPTQFNNSDDLIKYPRTLEQDLILLEEHGCDFVYTPDESDVYKDEKRLNFDLGGVDLVLEGASRPGHFEGVARVVKLLFDKVQPDSAYFGLKDYQQCQVIQKLVDQFALNIELHFVPTLREDSGLAMSSRNLRLSEEQRAEAAIIYKALLHCKENFREDNMAALEKEAVEMIEMAGFNMDYFTIVDSKTLRKPAINSESGKQVALTAVFADNVRLIDNLILN